MDPFHNVYFTRSSPKGKTPEVDLPQRTSYKWDPERKTRFFELCLQEMEAGNRSSGGINATGLKSVAATLTEEFGEHCKHDAVRNYWTQQKQQWSLAKTLLHSSTGLGLDPDTGAIMADDAWWDQAAKGNPDIKKLKGKNILELEEYEDQLFKNNTATGQHVLYPSAMLDMQGLQQHTAAPIDLNLASTPTPDTGSCRASRQLFVDLSGSTKAPVSTQTNSSKRRSSQYSSPQKRTRKQSDVAQLVEMFEQVHAMKDQHEIPTHLDYMPLIEQVREIDSGMAMFGATLRAKHLEL